MLSVSINEPELRSIEYFRIALSEPRPELRARAIANAKHEVVEFRLGALGRKLESEWISDPKNTKFVQWIASSSSERHESSYQFLQTAKQYEAHNERKLNVAEHIGKLIWLSIQDQRFEGVQTQEGILKQVSDQAQKYKISGGRDTDTLRRIWNTYRGVVHLGMAIDFCEDNPQHEFNVLHLAEDFRRSLSHFCPKGTKKPYVSEHEQILFLYCSNTWGPRFQDRGLPFSIG
jgi:hypothetical protein